MGQLLQQILLSDAFLFLILGVVMLLISSWAFRIKEYAGYVLGWLLGFLLMIIMSAFSFQATPEIDSGLWAPAPAFLMGMIVAALVGVVLGFAATSLLRANSYTESRIKRGLAVAITTSYSLSAGYFMLITDHSTRLVVAIFVLALAVGAMVNYILSRRSARQLAMNDEPVLEGEIVETVPEAENELDLPSPLAQRIYNLHQRAHNPPDRMPKL